MGELLSGRASKAEIHLHSIHETQHRGGHDILTDATSVSHTAEILGMKEKSTSMQLKMHKTTYK